jgi:hypothetical protein
MMMKSCLDQPVAVVEEEEEEKTGFMVQIPCFRCPKKPTKQSFQCGG